MSRSWVGGSTRRWRRVRAFVLARDGYVCQVRIPGVCTQRATCVHHVYGRAATGDDERYLVASCSGCNLTIGDPAKHDPKPSPHSSW
jgi:hypothetical protein